MFVPSLRRPAFSFFLLGMLGSLSCDEAIAAVGRTAGQPNVAPSGAAQYSIPLWTPPGTNGLQPSLALTYSSSTGNGLLGMGWSISGLSAITRCHQSFAQDGAIALAGLHYGDKFCLDGSRLRLVSGTYGYDSSTYQTEVESFRRITAIGTAGQGPASFEVRAKNGLIYEYGNSTSSRIEPLASGGPWPTARTWALNKIRDRSNNYVEFTYIEDATYGSYRPDEIRWTGNSGTGQSPQYKVKFWYESVPRPDYVYGYKPWNVTGVSGQDTLVKRLDYIEVLSGTTIVRKYDVTWAPGGAGDRSRIGSIVECGLGGADCYPATTLSWINGTSGWNSTETNTGQAIPSGVTPMVMDISGDGRDDVVYSSSATSGSGYWCYMLGTSTGFASQVCTSILNYNYSQALPIEFDGDGLRDILVPYSGGVWHVLRANGLASGFDTPSSTGVSSTGMFWVADVDGDTRGDLLRGSNTTGGTGYCQIWVRLRSGSGFGTEGLGFQCDPRVKLNGGTPFGLLEYKWRSAVKWPDFNGDGREDVVIAVIETDPEVPTTQYGMILAGYGGSALDYSGETLSPVTSATHWRFGDMNGDGLTDLAVGRNGALIFMYSQGGGWIVSGLGATAAVLLTDWDSDGLADYAIASGSPVYWWWSRNTGAGFTALTNSFLPAVSSPAAATGDFSGDGLHDLIRADSTIKYRPHQGIRPDLLDWIKDGFDIRADFDYAPLTDASIYLKTTGAMFPTREYQGSMHVAKRLTFTNGTGGDSYIDYTYSGARIHGHGRGFLGFAKRTQVDSRNGIYTEENFQQDHFEYAWIGTPTSVVVKQSAGGNKIRETTNTWQKHIYNSGTWDERRFPYVSARTIEDYEITPPYNGTLIRTTTTNTVIGASDYGSPTNVSTTVTENATGLSPGATHTQITSVTLATPDTSNWCVGRADRTLFTSSHSHSWGSSITRTLDRDWDTVKCRETRDTVEPDSTQWKVTTEYLYDDDPGSADPDFGNIVRVTLTPVGQAARVTSAYWGTNGQFPLTITNPASHTTANTWIVDRGLLDTVTDPNGLVVNLDYDNFNRKTRELQPDGTATRWSIGACTSPSYCGDSLLRYYVQRDIRNTADGILQDRYIYFDQLDREKYDEPRTLSGSLAVTHTVYDALGRVYTRSVPYVSGDPYKVVTYTHDLLNRLKKEEREVSEVDSSFQSTQWTYEGLTVTETDALSRSTIRKLTAIGQVAQVIDAAGNDTDYEYDAFGNLLKTRDVYGNEATLSYNVRGFKVTQSDPDLGSLIYDYFPLGELKSQTDAKGQTAYFDPYDPLGRPTTRHEIEGDTTWTWGALAADHNIGQLASMTYSASGSSETYTYDGFGRLAETKIVADGGTYYLSQSYNSSSGFLETLTYPTSTSGVRLKVKYAYQNGYLKTVHDYTGDMQTTKYWEAISTNARGVVMDEEFGNGLRTFSKYDHIAGWLDYRQSAPGGGSSTQYLNYAWDKVGNLSQRKDENQVLTENFFYDSLNRLDYTSGVSSLDLTYDAIGNITNRNDVGSYTYHATKKHAVTAAGTNTYAYDANGNMNSRNGASISWTSYNLPSLINQSGGNSSTFSYDAYRQRYKQVSVESSTTTTTIYVGGVLEKATAGSATDWKHYVQGGNGLAAIVIRSSSGTNTTYYLLKDHLGSVDQVTNSSGSVTVALSYTAFGKRRGSNWTGSPTPPDWIAIGSTTRRGFTEHEHLDNLALVHMNGRVYDLTIGRFISADPFVPDPFDAQSFNRFSYVHNNPLSFIDPSGFNPNGSPSCPDCQPPTPDPPIPIPIPPPFPDPFPCPFNICHPGPGIPTNTDPPVYQAPPPSDTGVQVPCDYGAPSCNPGGEHPESGRDFFGLYYYMSTFYVNSIGYRVRWTYSCSRGLGCTWHVVEVRGDCSMHVPLDNQTRECHAGIANSYPELYAMGGTSVARAAFAAARSAATKTIPGKALDTLNHVRRTGAPPSGHVGGRVFKNAEGRLPAGGRYREYDVDPAPGMGGSRNAERIVIDENTGRAWYTNDHYGSFREI